MYGYQTIKRSSIKPGKHTMFIEFQPGREAEVKVVDKRQRKGEIDLRVERFGWMGYLPSNTMVAVIK